MSTSMELSKQLSNEQRSLVESLQTTRFAYKSRRDAKMAMARVKGQWNEGRIDSSRMYQPLMIVQIDTRPGKSQTLHGYLKRKNMLESIFGGSRMAV